MSLPDLPSSSPLSEDPSDKPKIPLEINRLSNGTGREVDQQAWSPDHSLTRQDIESLKRSYLDERTIAEARIRRVDTFEGAQIVGKTPKASESLAGLEFPYIWPGENRIRESRLRRDFPRLERKSNGVVVEREKYLSAPGKSSMAYIPPGTEPKILDDTSIPISITEGEKKALALNRFHRERGEMRLIVSFPGVWNWKGVVGKTTNNQGQRQSIKGVIPDIDRIQWSGRPVLIIFDANVLTDDNVAGARNQLAKELTSRGAAVKVIDLPSVDGLNGIDDLLAARGPDYVAGLLSNPIKLDSESRPIIWHKPIPLQVEDIPDFPLDALPEVISNWASSVSEETQTPVDLAAIDALGCAAAAVGGNVELHIEGQHREALALWLTSVLGSGEGKSLPLKVAAKPIRDAEKRLIDDHKEVVKRIVSERRKIESQIKQASKDKNIDLKSLEAQLDELAIPPSPQLTGSDITPEALGTTLFQQDGRLAIISAEGDFFEQATGRYSRGTPNIDTALKAWDAEDVDITRKGGTREYIPGPVLNMVLSIQPAVIADLSRKPQIRGKGFLARCLMAQPKSSTGKRDWMKRKVVPIDPDYYKTIEALIGIPPLERPKRDAPRMPRLARLNQEAITLFKIYRQWIETELCDGGLFAEIPDWANKLAGQSARIATVLHLAERASRNGRGLQGLDFVLGPEDLARGIKIGIYFAEHAIKIFGDLGSDRRTQAAKKVLTRIEKLAEGNTDPEIIAVSRADIWATVKGSRGTIQTSEDLTAALDLLVDHEMVKAIAYATKNNNKGERVATVYALNPEVIKGHQGVHIAISEDDIQESRGRGVRLFKRFLEYIYIIDNNRLSAIFNPAPNEPLTKCTPSCPVPFDAEFASASEPIYLPDLPESETMYPSESPLYPSNKKMASAPGNDKGRI